MIQIYKRGSFTNFKHNIPLLISFCAFACLTVNSIAKAVFALLGALVLIFVSFYTKVEKENFGRNFSKGTIASVAMLHIILGTNFYSMMINSSKIMMIADMLGISNLIIVFLLACIGAIVASYFSFWVISIVYSNRGEAQLKAVIDSNCVKNIAIVLAVLGMTLATVCSFNGSIWADEAFSLRVIQYSYREIVSICAKDVHPPLYYLALKAVEDFGANFFNSFYSTVVVGKLFSVLAYVVLTLLCWYKFRDEKEVRPFVLLCIYGMPQLVQYAVEIRMYSWALLFVTASFLFARDIIFGKNNQKPWVWFSIFSLLSAYTHTFALIAVASIWLYLLIWILQNSRKEITKWFCYGSLVGILFIPWLFVLFRQVGYVKESYWIAPITRSSIPYFVKYVFPGILPLILYLLVIGISEKHKIEKGFLFESAFGILIPLTTLVVGIIASVIIRPVFVPRYMIPGLMCMWLSIVLILKKCNFKIQTIVILMLFMISANSLMSFTTNENVSRREAANNISLVESFEEEAIVIISCNTHTTDVVASYIDNMVYNWRGPELITATKKIREVYTNGAIFDNVSQINEWLNDGIPLYYVETKDSKEEERLPIPEGEWSLEYIGEYKFENDSVVYRIVFE